MLMAGRAAAILIITHEIHAQVLLLLWWMGLLLLLLCRGRGACGLLHER